MSLASPKPSTERKSALTFEDLPPEIRNEIYELALTSPDVVEVAFKVSHKVAGLIRLCESLRSQGRDDEADDILRVNGWYHSLGDKNNYFRCSQTFRDITILKACPGLSPRLLEVSRILNMEATSILYGINCFEIRAHDFEAFAKAIGTSIKHVRHLKIMVSGGHHEYVKSITKLLSTAKSLQDLEFVSLKYGKANSSPKNMAGHLRMWAIRAIKARAEGEGRKASSPREIAEIIRFSGQVKVEDYTAQVQKALVKLLEEPKPPRTSRRKT
ncbi:hypothetical protein TI39_contig4204g00013 [Zymoseptoria brevis]|uniref:2EXR domain-containing protein n=1 Tax=Zymoseptoria brevis TaxID=1047168 RepID=A0A0F4GA67_9PEZI|nr:hypothetical protein TI39_contig4204g00013 [Zymoseptoria brevis]